MDKTGTTSRIVGFPDLLREVHDWSGFADCFAQFAGLPTHSLVSQANIMCGQFRPWKRSDRRVTPIRHRHLRFSSFGQSLGRRFAHKPSSSRASIRSFDQAVDAAFRASRPAAANPRSSHQRFPTRLTWSQRSKAIRIMIGMGTPSIQRRIDRISSSFVSGESRESGLRHAVEPPRDHRCFVAMLPAHARCP